jgi:hypothetical protein
MRRGRLGAVTLVVALLVGGCAEDVPEASTTAEPSSVEAAELAQRFAPLVWLAEGEENYPMNATDFVGRSELRFDHGSLCEDDEPVADVVAPARLGDGSYRHRAYPQPVGTETPRCDHEAGIEYDSTDDVPSVLSSQGFYLDLDDAARPGDRTLAAPTYWERHEDESGLVAYVYWLFYGYNDYNNKHEGDWERIAVQVRGEEPVAVTFWKHEEPTCVVKWSEMDVADGHPTVFAASGAHGSYPSIGSFGHPGGIDQTTAGESWRTWSSARAVDAEPWWGYRGMWGDAGPQHFRGPRGPYPGREQKGVFTSRECVRPDPVPEAFVGEWESPEPVRQIPSHGVATYYMRVTFRADGRHEISYRDDWDTTTPGFGCSGSLTVVGATATSVTVKELITDTEAGNCVAAGDAVFTKTRDDLQWQYTGEDVIADALLVRRSAPSEPTR